MATKTLTLTEFLLARIAEVEEVARSVPDVDAKSSTAVFTSLSEPTGTVEMSPARVLAECEAKRRIVEEHPRDDDGYCYDSTTHLRGCKWLWPCPTLRALALPYADHPDCREEWRAQEA